MTDEASRPSSAPKPRPSAAPLGAFRQGDDADTPEQGTLFPMGTPAPGSRETSAQDARRFARFRASTFARATGGWLLAMLALSLIVHGAAVIGAADVRVGFVDPSAFERTPRMVRIKRAARDTVLLPGETLDPTQAVDPADFLAE
ncbi:MAG: hypothetical protein AAF916_09280, partial [Planctomycetota bacterium]